jgi:hypothetical protein
MRRLLPFDEVRGERAFKAHIPKTDEELDVDDVDALDDVQPWLGGVM